MINTDVLFSNFRHSLHITAEDGRETHTERINKIKTRCCTECGGRLRGELSNVHTDCLERAILKMREKAE